MIFIATYRQIIALQFVLFLILAIACGNGNSDYKNIAITTANATTTGQQIRINSLDPIYDSNVPQPQNVWCRAINLDHNVWQFDLIIERPEIQNYKSNALRGYHYMWQINDSAIEGFEEMFDNQNAMFSTSLAVALDSINSAGVTVRSDYYKYISRPIDVKC